MAAYDVGIAIPTVRRQIDLAVRDYWVLQMGQDEERISWPNVQFDTPHGKPWLSVAHNFGEAVPRTQFQLGGGLSLQRAFLMLTVFGPKMEGTAVLDEMASMCAAGFSRRTVCGVEFSSFDGPHSVGNPSWASAQVAATYWFYLCYEPTV
jgi:hypothetical protein